MRGKRREGWEKVRTQAVNVLPQHCNIIAWALQVCSVAGSFSPSPAGRSNLLKGALSQGGNVAAGMCVPALKLSAPLSC